MSRRSWLAGIIVLAAGLLQASGAMAGGWATITVDEWPSDVQAGQAVVVRFTVRQHGRDTARVNDLSPVVRAWNTGSAETISVNATAEGRQGVYRAAISFPSAGEWAWSIEAFSVEQPMPEIQVKQGQAQPVDASGLSPALATTLGVLGLAGAAAALALALARRARWALLLAAASLCVAGAGFASAAQPAQETTAASQTAWSPAEYGETLFVAKGCLTCHLNRRIDQSYVVFTTESGPQLTDYQAAPEFLRMWLKDPLAVRPPKDSNFPMPNLELSEEEIEALIAFINADREE